VADAGCVAELFGEIRQHRLKYPLVYGGCGVVVEVYRTCGHSAVLVEKSVRFIVDEPLVLLQNFIINKYL
jgi:hypothetical protein